MSTNYEVSETDQVACILTINHSHEEDNTHPLVTKGEVTEKTENTLQIESPDRTIEIDLNNKTGRLIGSTMLKDTENEFPVSELSRLTIDDVLLSHDLPDYAERYTEGEDGIQNTSEVVERANVAVEKIVNEFGETWLRNSSWVGHNNAFEAYDVYKNGIQQRIDAHNERQHEHNNREIIFPNKESALLWIEEICGQISDGAWEGKVENWKDYFGAEVKIDTNLETAVLDGHLSKLEYREELLEFDGNAGRLMFYVLASGINPEFDRKDLEETLGQIEAMHD